MERPLDRVKYRSIDPLPIGEADLQLLRVHIDIHDRGVQLEHHDRKGKFMLHEEGAAAILQRPC